MLSSKVSKPQSKSYARFDYLLALRSLGYARGQLAAVLSCIGLGETTMQDIIRASDLSALYTQMAPTQHLRQHPRRQGAYGTIKKRHADSLAWIFRRHVCARNSFPEMQSWANVTVHLEKALDPVVA